MKKVFLVYGINWSVFQEMATYKTCHNHINWGWNGAGNGYFQSSVLDATYPLQSDYSPYSLPVGDIGFYTNVVYFAVWH